MYNKLFTKILDSSIWLEPDATRLVWLTLIAAMDEQGLCQFAAVGNLAHRARVSLRATEKAVTALESPDPDSSDPDHAGRRIERVEGGWLVLNAEKYRNLVSRVVQQEQTRERVRKHRAKKREELLSVTGVTANGTVTPSEAYTEAESEAEEEKNAPPPRLSTRASQTKTQAGGSKRPIYQSDRFVVFEWQLWELERMLGPHVEAFDLHAFFDALTQDSRSKALVISGNRRNSDFWPWLQQQVLEEAKRRKLPVAELLEAVDPYVAAGKAGPMVRG